MRPNTDCGEKHKLLSTDNPSYMRTQALVQGVGFMSKFGIIEDVMNCASTNQYDCSGYENEELLMRTLESIFLEYARIETLPDMTF